jgi:ribose 5-phosphate isomerase A
LDTDAQKRAAAARAVDFIESGMKVGLGTGSTAEYFLEALAERLRDGRLRDVVGTPTSRRTEEKARSLGIPVADLNELRALDVVVDGADEADANLNLIKGGGGALLREKIVAASASRMIVIADESKYVRQLGSFPLPVEVVAFGHVTTEARLQPVVQYSGYKEFTIALRRKADGSEFRTDSGNVIYDVHLNKIRSPEVLSDLLHRVPGVVEHGLFLELASLLVLGGPDGARVIERPKRS